MPFVLPAVVFVTVVTAANVAVPAVAHRRAIWRAVRRALASCRPRS